MGFILVRFKMRSAKIKLFIIFLALFFSFSELNAELKFSHGRLSGGNLVEPRSPKATENFESVSEQYFNQKLDHFNPTDTRTWEQRFLTNDAFYDGNGPIFLMLGGEGRASDVWMTQGNWIDLAQKYKAFLFQLEHRFYGESHPTEDLSMKNLVYLTSQQALADMANFIVGTNQKLNFTSDTKWIVFGGSYSGALAAWARLKYPHLLHGAVAASAPIWAKVDFHEYFRVVAESLATYSDQCVTAVQQGFEQIGVLLKREIGQENLNQLFNLCDPIQDSVNNKPDLGNLYETIAATFAAIVQYNNDTREEGALTIDLVCDVMLNETIGGPIDRLASATSLLFDTKNRCLEYKYQTMVDEIRKVSWDSKQVEGGWRQWMYQTCTELGFYQTSEHEPHVFGEQFPIEYFIQECQDLFGESYTTDFLEKVTNRTNTIYGGLGIDVTNVVFTHGSLDPWHSVGVLQDVNDQAPVIYIEGTAHCADLYPADPADLPQLKEARNKINFLVGTWLGISTENN